jgi:hypothetical protein
MRKDVEASGVVTVQNRLSKWYTENLSVWEELLGELAFLTKYDLLRLEGSTPAESGHIWKVRVLKGANFNPPGVEWPPQRQACDECHTLALWSREQERSLFLLPFAIFSDHETRPRDRLDFAKDFFYYERFEHGEMTYVGLRGDEEGLNLPSSPKRITLQKHIDVIQKFEREATDGISPVADWPQMVKRCRSLSWDQLRVFQRDKYDPGVYVLRAEVEEHFGYFLESGLPGFLVVGDSGTGKTNFLCSLAERLLLAGETVILYNCADIREDKPNITQALEKSLDLSVPMLDFCRQMSMAQPGGVVPRRLYCLFDAVNEAQNPLALLEDLVGFVRELALADLGGGFDVKVVMSCRSESWQRLRSAFVGDRYFYQSSGQVAQPLQRFGLAELETVYDKYRERYNLRTGFEELSEAVKSFIRDPLMLRFLAESFEARSLPAQPGTRAVFERYISAKIGYREEKLWKENVAEQAFVEKLVAKMNEASRDAVDIREDLRSLSDQELRQQVINPKLDSPPWQLRDKGVLTSFGRRDLADREPQKMKFTYDRVFEYLLQRYLLSGELGVADRDRIVAEVQRSKRFPSLWGAVRVALQMYFDDQESSSAPLLTTLATSTDPTVRAMVVDVLTDYGLDRPDKVEDYLLKVLLLGTSEDGGQVAVQVAYELGLVNALFESLTHSQALVRQLATQNVFYLWQRAPEKGIAIVTRLYERIEKQWKSLIPSVLRNWRNGARGVDLITGLDPFFSIAILVLGYAYMAKQDIRPIGVLFSKLIALIFHGALAPGVKLFLKSWSDGFLGGVMQAAPEYGSRLLRAVEDFSAEHPYRKSIATIAKYVDPDVPITNADLDAMFAIAEEPIATPMFFIAMTFYARGRPRQRDLTFSFCRRLFETGNIYAKNLALRIASQVVFMEELGGEYMQFVEEMSLELWAGKESVYQYPIKESASSSQVQRTIPVGLLHAPVIYECRTRTGGASEFIEKLLQLPWDGDPTYRIVRILECLEGVITMAAPTTYTTITPLLETIRKWVDSSDEAIRSKLIHLLSLARSFYPDQVDRFLESLRDESANTNRENSQERNQLVRDVQERFQLYPLSKVFIGSLYVGAPWLQQNSKFFSGLMTELLLKAATDEYGWDQAVQQLSVKIASPEMLGELGRVLSEKEWGG